VGHPNVDQTDTLMRQANDIVNKAGGSMAELTFSMQAINRSSEHTSKFVQTRNKGT
jgi:hypothetical protein